MHRKVELTSCDIGWEKPKTLLRVACLKFLCGIIEHSPQLYINVVQDVTQANVEENTEWPSLPFRLLGIIGAASRDPSLLPYKTGLANNVLALLQASRKSHLFLI